MPQSNKRVDLAAFIRRQVVDRAGQPLGRIGALHLAMDEGRLESVTLCLESSRAGGRRDVVIPWSQFKVAGDGERLVLDISRDVLSSVATGQRDRRSCS
jgi:sporulation protein YlmC with PRC-barrel domain